MLNSLLRKENLRLKILEKQQGLILSFDELKDETSLLNQLAYELSQNVYNSVLLQKSIQISDRKYFSIASKIRQLCTEFNATFIIESQPLMASLLNADSILLTQDDLTFSQIHEYLPQNIIIGWEYSKETLPPKEAEYIITYNSEPISNCITATIIKFTKKLYA